jgi:hypothetical protein
MTKMPSRRSACEGENCERYETMLDIECTEGEYNIEEGDVLAVREVGAMKQSRREILIRVGLGAGAALLGVRTAAAQNQMPGVSDQGQNPSQQMPGEPPPSPEEQRMAEAATKAMLEQNQKQIKQNVEKLYKLASELKEQVEKTDSSKVLSLNLVKKAEEIEKLAKQIKDRAKG